MDKTLDKNSFDITKIKEIEELEINEHNNKTINKLIQEGWVLLAVGQISELHGTGLAHRMVAILGKK